MKFIVFHNQIELPLHFVVYIKYHDHYSILIYRNMFACFFKKIKKYKYNTIAFVFII